MNVSKNKNLTIDTHIKNEGGHYKKINTQLAPPIKNESPNDLFVPKFLTSTIIEATKMVGSSLKVDIPKLIIPYLDYYKLFWVSDD